MVIFTLGLFLFSIAAITYQFSAHTRQEMEVSLSNQQLSEVSFVAERIDNAVSLRIDSLALAANSLTPEIMAHRGRTSAFLAERKTIGRLFTLGTIVISKDGHAIADFPQADGRGSADYSQIEFFRQIIATGKPAISKPSLGRFIKKPRLVIAVPIFDKNQRIIGVFAGITSLADNSLLSDFDANLHPNQQCLPDRLSPRQSVRRRYRTSPHPETPASARHRQDA